MKSPRKSALPVTEKTPEESEPAEELIEPPRPAPKPEPPINFEDRLAMLEQGQRIADRNFEILQDTLTKLEPLVAAVATASQQAQQQTPTLPGGNLQVPPWLQQILSGVGGGGGDNEFMELAKESMRADISFTKALKSAVISKITGGATSEIAKAAAGE